ncbi:MAG: helix-turn-helix domain-containing protein [Treponema sp.]|nr:helix-turn-helix domain-containing protein [Treponema sp.]MCR5620421.1 helix-turn-helix domain-containing protein [Treponema sp.]
MAVLTVNEYSKLPKDVRRLKSGDEETLKRGSLVFPIQYYLSNTVDSSYDLPVHWHKDFEIIHVISGCYNILVGHDTYELKKDDLCIIPGKLLHGDAEKKSIALFESVVFDPDMIRIRSYVSDDFINASLSGELELAHVIPAGNAEISAIAKEFFQSFKDMGDGFELRIPALILLLFSELKRQHLYSRKKVVTEKKARQAQQFESVMNFIKENYGNQIGLEELASIVGLSPKYFCRLFRELTQRSPIEYLNWFRINMACDKLRNTDQKLADIAFDCGFNDLSYFIKTFRNYKGVTPLKYRNIE